MKAYIQCRTCKEMWERNGPTISIQCATCQKCGSTGINVVIGKMPEWYKPKPTEANGRRCRMILLYIKAFGMALWILFCIFLFSTAAVILALAVIVFFDWLHWSVHVAWYLFWLAFMTHILVERSGRT